MKKNASFVQYQYIYLVHCGTSLNTKTNWSERPLNLLLMQAVKGRLSLLIVVSNTNTARNNTIIHNLKSKNKYNFFIASKVKYIEVNVCYISNELGGTLWTYHSLSLPYCLFLYSMFLIYQIFTRLFQFTKSSDFQNPATLDFAHTQIFLAFTQILKVIKKGHAHHQNWFWLLEQKYY